ncbi:hypothetical protein [Halorussus halophilus]|uniref:hypothetical protein n=1 Tax=Halorussus halophilus TaxID=2650975 RepID=UPI001CE40E4D|nr:hypothetical protein [Halorussus halophilus]
MNTDVEPSDWTCLDSWWSTYTRSESINQNLNSAHVLDNERLHDCWGEFDPWWQVQTDSSPIAQDFASAQVFVMERLTDCWEELDSWWHTYIETGNETAATISGLLAESNEEWERSDAPFDTDPLTADLSRNWGKRGPLQPNGEVEWSRWLAQLLRPTKALGTELFDLPADEAPNEVIREDQLSKPDGSIRRPDLLLFYAKRGVSIEVKLGDENYRKTADTAKLVEQHYDDQRWAHTLLLPKRQKKRLDAIVEPALSCKHEEQLQIEWADPGPIDVLYWRDVTAAIRSVLRQGLVDDDHWAANAYLFCAVAEQRIMNFQPQSVVKRLAAPTNVVDTIQPIRITDTLEEQLTYLRERVDP